MQVMDSCDSSAEAQKIACVSPAGNGHERPIGSVFPAVSISAGNEGAHTDDIEYADDPSRNMSGKESTPVRTKPVWVALAEWRSGTIGPHSSLGNLARLRVSDEEAAFVAFLG
jgi:hypothetical protein